MFTKIFSTESILNLELEIICLVYRVKLNFKLQQFNI